jgi:hypothetical protein
LSRLIQHAWACHREEIASREGYMSKEVNGVADTLEALGISYQRDVILGDNLMLLQIVVSMAEGAPSALFLEQIAK